MIEIATALIGFAAPFLPELLKYFQRSQDCAHELAMFKLQMERGAAEHLWRMEEISSQADIAEATMLHSPQQSFGVQLLDAAKNSKMSGWALYPAFGLFALMDFLSGMVRPAITYAAFAFYVVVKWAQLQAALAESGSYIAALPFVWGDADRAIIVLVLSYWFGHRAAKAAFGGSAITAMRGS
jgi:hypothetical protein